MADSADRFDPVAAYSVQGDFTRKVLFTAIGVLLGLTWVTVWQALAQNDLVSPRSAQLWFGFTGENNPFLTIQMAIWIAFGIGLAELAKRYLYTRDEMSYLATGPIPGKPATLIKSTDLKSLYEAASSARKDYFLPRLIIRAIVAYRVSRSISQASSVVQLMISNMADDLEIRYGLMRYVIWLIPSLGFIGTVFGISQGLEVLAANPPTVENAPSVMQDVTSALSVAFDTTFVALILTSILALLLHMVQTREEKVLNLIAQYITDHLINRLSRTE